MASQFYNRYIPQVPDKSDPEEAPKPTKKRKKTHPEPEALRATPSIPTKKTKESHEELSSSDQDPGSDTKLHGLEPLPQPAQAECTPTVSASSFLPPWLQSPTIASFSGSIPFEKFSLPQKTLSSLQKKGYDTASALQSAVLPMLLPGPQHYIGDLCISAATGSGKTLAYALPMVEALRGKPVTRLRGLIIVPTRELVRQVKETLDLCGGGSGIKVGTAIGSKPLKEEQALLVNKGQRYDPEGYRAEQEKEIDEDEELMDWDFDKRFGPRDDFELLYNHVVEYTSKVDVLICTPGRLVEHIQSTTGFTLEHVQCFVIDEADRLLDESFQQWIHVVLPGLDYLPPLNPIQQRIQDTFHMLRRREIRKIILSATITRDVSKLTTLKLRRPRLVVLEGQQSHEISETTLETANVEAGERIELPATLHEVGLKVPDSNEKPLYLIRILEAGGDPAPKDALESPSKNEDSVSSPNSGPNSNIHSPSARNKVVKSLATSPPAVTRGTLIFTKTNENAARLARLLSLIRQDWTPKIGTLTKLSTKKSRKTLDSFCKAKLSILIASDRASRGLDIPDLAHVINYDIPSSLTSYIHRVGRTARAGKEGKATTLIVDNEARWFWNEIARAENVGRGPGRKVVRDNSRYEFDDEEREMYQVALEKLGQEARG